MPNKKKEQLDFLSPPKETHEEDLTTFTKPQPKKRWPKIITLAVSATIFIISSLLYIQVSASPFAPANKNFTWISAIKRLISNDYRELQGEADDRINILLLGMGGMGHDGAYLTDTIILASFKPSTKEVALVSIPRDLYVPIEGYGWRKINHANAYGETKNPGQGAKLAMQVIANITGQPIPYYVRIDFNNFKKIIDDLGGIDVYVSPGFTDTQYPDGKHGTKTITFQEGQQHFDGERALAYARSRHGNNGQGSDFARSRRQMQIIMAIKDKVLSTATLLNPNRIINLYNNLIQNIQTNLKPWEVLRLAQLIKGMRQSDIITKVIDNGPNGLLRSYISETGAYVLTTRSGDFSELHQFFANIFNENKETKTKTAASAPSGYSAKLAIVNGTYLPGLATQTANKLKAKSFQIIHIGNAAKRDYNQTVIIRTASQDKNKSEQLLQQLLNAPVTTELPLPLQEKILTDNPQLKSIKDIDFIIVLGTDTKK